MGSVADHCETRSDIQYKFRWYRCSAEHNTWEPTEGLSEAFDYHYWMTRVASRRQ